MMQDTIRKSGIDAAFFLSANGMVDSNITYLAGLNCELCGLILPAEGRPILVIPKMERENARRFFKGRIVCPDKFLQKVLRLLSKYQIVGINEDLLSVSSAKKLRKAGCSLVNIAKVCEEIREVKQPAEIKLIERSCRLSDTILEGCIARFGAFRTEEDVQRWLQTATEKAGLEFSFKPIIASGSNASMPHHAPGGKLRKGFCIIDFGVKNKNYCSDTTRTLYLGKPADKEREIYCLLLNVQEEMVRRAKPGVIYTDLDKQCRRLMGKYARYFIHGLGHLIGIDVHENCDKEKLVLKEGMTLTLEPGIYVKGKYGIRIEDTVLITANGSRRLTKIPKELVVVNSS